jgi:hypothetical protein
MNAKSAAKEDVYSIAYEFILCLHLNPTQKYPTIFIDLAANVTDKNSYLLPRAARGICFYSSCTTAPQSNPK